MEGVGGGGDGFTAFAMARCCRWAVRRRSTWPGDAVRGQYGDGLAGGRGDGSWGGGRREESEGVLIYCVYLRLKSYNYLVIS